MKRVHLQRAIGLGILGGGALSLLVLLAGCASVGAMGGRPQSWEGVYEVAGQNPDGSPYAGFLEIQAVPETEHFLVTWATDEDPVRGFGFEVDGQLAVTGLTHRLIAVFKRNGEGRWALPRADRHLGRERLTRTSLKTLPANLPQGSGLQASR